MNNSTNEDASNVRTFEYPGITVRVYIPVLTDEERAKRMKQIHNQASNLLRKAK